MRRVLFITLILVAAIVTGSGYTFAKDNTKEVNPGIIQSENEPSETQADPILPSIFIWQTPDDDETATVKEDDIYGYDYNSANDNTYGYVDDLYVANYDTVQLKGYLDYIDDSDAIGLKNSDNTMALNIRVPQKFQSKKIYKNSANLPNTTFSRNIYGRSSDLQYNIAPLDFSTELKQGGFSVGTSYNESIDYADLGFTASFFTKYENRYFALSTSYDKVSGVSYSDNIDKFSFTPEIKLNRHISIRDILTSDITRNRRKNEVVLSIKPCIDDKVRFEFGAGQIFDENSVLLRSQVKFSTQYKW